MSLIAVCLELKYVSVSEQLHPSLRIICTMPSNDWSGVKHNPTRLGNSRNSSLQG